MRLKTELKAFDINDAKYRDLTQYIDKYDADTKIFELSKALLDKEYPYHGWIDLHTYKFTCWWKF